MANIAAEIVWITHLLRELHALPPDRTTLLCDNRNALFLTQNPISHKRAKHINIDYHFVCELVASGQLYTRFPYVLTACRHFYQEFSQGRS